MTSDNIKDHFGKAYRLVRAESYDGSSGCEWPDCSRGADFFVTINVVRESIPNQPYRLCSDHAHGLNEGPVKITSTDLDVTPAEERFGDD